MRTGLLRLRELLASELNALNDFGLISYPHSIFYAQIFGSSFLIYYMLAPAKCVNVSRSIEVLGGWFGWRSDGAVLAYELVVVTEVGVGVDRCTCTLHVCCCLNLNLLMVR